MPCNTSGHALAAILRKNIRCIAHMAGISTPIYSSYEFLLELLDVKLSAAEFERYEQRLAVESIG